MTRIEIDRIEIDKFQARLERYLDKMAPDDIYILCRRGVPVAEIRRPPSPRSKPRPIGLERGRFSVPESFFDPLPADFLDAFENGPVFPEE